MSETTPNILVVNSSGRVEGSTTRKLINETVAGLSKKLPGASIVNRDLADGVPLIDQSWIEANFTPSENRSDAQSEALATSDMFVRELQNADTIVIGAPIYNFSIPAALKAWIDQIARARVTFRYTEDGPVGLLEGKRAILVIASGGVAVDGPGDFSTAYLKHILAFVGITDVEIIAADQQSIDAEKATANAQTNLNDIVENFAA